MKRTGLVIVGIVLLMVVLGAAAYVGGQLLRNQQETADKINSAALPRKLVTPAAGLPATDPDARGDVTSRSDNSVVICDPNYDMSIDPDGSVNGSSDCGPSVEVLIGHDTVLIHDITALQNPKPDKQGQDAIIHQVTEPGSPADIGQGTAVRAWGVRTGNRLVARTLLYWNRAPRASATPGS